MTYEIIWKERAIDAASRFLKDDPDGLRQVFDGVDLLANDPRPAGSAEYGSPDLRRVHIGMYRVLYEVFDSKVLIIVLHLGRAG